MPDAKQTKPDVSTLSFEDALAELEQIVRGLENGQHWKVLKGKLTLPKAMVNPEVEIAPGMAGRWFFHVDEDLPGARVYRVD